MANLKLAFRTLAKTPFVTAVAVLSLALGIGANAAIFSLTDQTLLSALPVDQPDRLVNLSAPGPSPGSTSCNQAGGCDEIFSYPMFRDLQGADTGLSGIAAHRLFGVNLATDERTQGGNGVLVSGNYFELLGVRPALGRLLTPADDRTIGGHPVVVLSHRFWTQALGADQAVLNDTLVVNGKLMTVVGVAQEGFDGTTLGGEPDIFVPISMRAALESFYSDEAFEDRRVYWAYLFGRLAPAMSIEQAGTAINVAYSAILQEVEAPLQEGMSDETMVRFKAKQVVLEPGQRGQSSIHEEVRTPMLLLFAITGVVLLIACANIANLLLARSASRSQELAVRNALGAGRGQLVGQLLIEAAVLAALGGLASLLVADWTLQVTASLLPAEAVDSFSMQLSPQVALFAGAVALGTSVLFGLYPALQATRPDLVTILKANSGQPSGARSAARFRTTLVTAQIALSMALLFAAGLFIKSLVNVNRVNLGLDETNVVSFTIAPTLNGYENEASLALFQQLEGELAAIPGVSSVTGALVPILTGNNWGTDVEVEGFANGPDIDSNARFNKVGPGYFSTLGMPLLAGREFTTADGGEDASKVAIVNEAFVRKFGLDGREAVGKLMTDDGEELTMEIVGLVRDARYANVKQDVPALFFTPYRQDFSFGWLTFYLRTGSAPESVMRAIPGVMKRLDPNLPVEDLKTLDQQVQENVFLDRMISVLSAAFAILATLLAAVGLYGVLAYAVAQRTREIGVRMALGASRGNVQRLVLRQIAFMLLIGGAIGLAAAIAVGQAAKSLLFGLEGHDPVVLTVGAVLLAVVALGAGYLPVRRASEVDPMQALRQD